MPIYVFCERIRDLLLLALVLVRYYACVAAPVRRRLRTLRRRAASIPDPAVRAIALGKLHGEHLNAEAAAVFATLGPIRSRPNLARLLVTFEAMYDFLDGVSELPSRDPVATGLLLHQALGAAVDESRTCDYYALMPAMRDDGYLDALAAECRRCLRKLASAPDVESCLLAAVERCGEAQTRTHAVHRLGSEQLERWVGERSSSRDDTAGYQWWETAAGAASSLRIHALLAAASQPSTSAATAAATEQAYGATAALSTLLDSFVDYEEDRVSGAHSYVAYYESSEHAVTRLSAIATDARRTTGTLWQAGTHRVIAAGVIGFYLSAARRSRRQETARIADGLGSSLVRAIIVAAALRRRVT